MSGDALDAFARAAEAAPYHAALGIRVEELELDRVRLRIPFQDANANPGRALHGGVYASAIDAAGVLAALSGVADLHALQRRTVDLSVVYLAAAIGADIVAEARVLRRGKELAYADVAVRDDAGRELAHGLVTHRFAPPGPPDRLLADAPPPDGSAAGELPKIARMIVAVPFIAARGMQITRMSGGRATVEMPCTPGNVDASRAVAEGALAALLDTAGAMASWSLTPMDLRSKASTAGIHVSFLASAPGEDVAAHARVIGRENESFTSLVNVYARPSGRALATGSVTYRIVLP